MKTNRLTLLIMLSLSLGLTVVHAQKAVIATGGNSSGSGGSVSYSVGQIAYSTATGTNGSVNQGVQQPYEFYVVGLQENPEVNLQLTVFPNPASSQVTLNTGKLNPAGLKYQLFGTDGKLLLSEQIQENLSVIPMEKFPPATYLLIVLNGKSEIQKFKIIKK